MTISAPNEGTVSPEDSVPRAEDRLESWKEIAGFFQCSVRAVQNWEKQEGLPVHRHHHKKLGTVYAYRSELEDWRRKRDSGSQGAPRSNRSRLAVAVAAVAVAGLALAALSMRGSSSPSALELDAPRRITSEASVADFPSWSPDGGSVAYHSTADGSFDIWTLELESGTTRNWTADSPAADRFPSWSPDGSRIAFHSNRDGGGYFVASLSDASIERVGDAPSDEPRMFHGVPQWSPDGSELAWLVMDESVETPSVVIHAVDGTSMRRLSVPGTTQARFDLAWSPTGRYFAYVDAHDAASDVASIWVYDTQEDSAHAVVARRRNDRRPGWSSDGRELYFLSEHDGSTDLWRQPLDENREALGEPMALTAGVDVRHAAFSPDSGRLAFSKGRTTANLWRLPVRAEGPTRWEDAQQVTFDEAFAEQPDLSPDGKRVAFTTDRRGGPRIWIVGVEDGSLRSFSDEAYKAWAPRWSPDGSEIAFYSYQSGNRDVWVRPVNGAEPRQITDHPSEDMYPAWSPDGERLAFISDRSGNWDIWTVPARGGEPTRLTHDPATDTVPQWSPDGEWILFSTERVEPTRLWMVPAAGGTERPVGAEQSAVVSRWPKDDRIYFHGRYESSGRIWELDVSQGSVRPITSLEGRSGSLWEEAFAADDDQIVVSWMEEASDLWLMDVRPEPR